jgi:predicted nuclease of predicted toxin-antitoxin system
VRFFLDHDVPAEAAHVLRHEGHEVTVLREVLPVTTVDLDAFKYANAHGLFLVTCNRDDFLALATAHSHAGLIVLIRRRSRQAECGNLLALLKVAGENGIAANINFA